MAKIIELKEITLNPGEEHIAASFPAAGFYHIINQGIFVIVYEMAGVMYCWHLFNPDAKKMIEQFKDTPEPKPEPIATLEEMKTLGTVSEEFALKAMAMVINKENYSSISPK